MKYVKFASLFVVCLLLLGMLTACAQPAAKKFVFASDASFPPMESVDMRPRTSSASTWT